MKIDFKHGDIVWSGKNGGQQGFKDYHIKIEDLKRATAKNGTGGCWCPPEAVEFLQSIGIRIAKSRFYNSRYAVVGCHFSTGIQPLREEVEIARRVFFNENPHELGKQLLRKWDDE